MNLARFLFLLSSYYKSLDHVNKNTETPLDSLLTYFPCSGQLQILFHDLLSHFYQGINIRESKRKSLEIGKTEYEKKKK